MKFLFLTLIALGAVYSTLIERNLIIKKKINIKSKYNNTETFRIAHFTDVHLGRFFSYKQLKKLVDKINETEADIVLLTGDLVDKMYDYKDDGDADKILAKIEAKMGKFSVYGNHDSYPGNRHTYAKIMENSGFTLLKNNNVKINIKGKTINLMGLDDFFQGKIDIEKTTENICDDDYNILMLHEPDLITKFDNYNIDLALAGHSHGGQVFVPLYGTILNTGLAESFDRNIYIVGKNKQTILYVNSGIGSTGLPIRFCCIPNVSVMDIALPDN